MSEFKSAAKIRKAAADLLDGPRWRMSAKEATLARELLPELRKLREFDLLTSLSERVARSYPRDPLIRRFQTQGLIETGHPTAAIEVAKSGLKGLAESNLEWSELYGLIGRAYKQIVMDAADPRDADSKVSLRESLKAYSKPYSKDPNNTWHAINLTAVSSFAKRTGIKSPTTLNATALATKIIETIDAKPEAERDHWDAATLAEAYMAVGNLDQVEFNLNTYLAYPGVSAFDVGSTLRQFGQVWGLQNSENLRERGILEALRARLLQLPGAEISLRPQELKQLQTQTMPSEQQLEAILGREGTNSYKWWKAGLDAACAVGAVYAGIDQRIGTCFLVRACDIKLNETNELLVLTNFHVVNPEGSGGALRLEDAQLAFEATDMEKRYEIKEVVWSSPVNQHDACLLRLTEEPAIQPLPIATALPVLAEGARVYVIGYPAGGGLAFSMQDNALLDHEGPQAGTPPSPDVLRVHYRAPTEKGSSGSPVFNRTSWQVIALHHAGGELPQLNGKPGTHPANEGIALASIIAAIKASRVKT